MTTFIIRRLIQALLVLVMSTMLVFLAMRLLPGDPLMLYIAENQLQGLTPEDMHKLQVQFGLDKSLPEQYVTWISGVLRGNLGTSIFYRMSVGKMIQQRMPITMHLGFFALVISAIVGITAGAISAIKRGTWIDNVITTTANLGITAPSFWIGVLMIYLFALKLGWLPVQGYVSPFTDFWQSFRLAVMPVTVLAIAPIASLCRQTRSSMLEVTRQDYVRTAKSKGLKEDLIIRRHMLKNALMPVITLLGMQVRVVFGGAVIIETVFNVPGMGRMMVDAVFGQDYTIVQAVALIMAVIVILSNLVVDVAYGWLDPRIQYS